MARPTLRRGQNDAEHINAAMGGRTIGFTVGAETDVKIALDSGSADWTASGSGTDEYYYDTDTSEPHKVFADSVALVAGTAGSLAAGEWGYGDNDTIGSSRIYVRLSDGADPDTAPATMEYTVEESITVAGQVVDDNGDSIDEAVLVTVMVSDAATGLGIAGTAPDSLVASVGSIVDTPVAGKLFTVQTNASGAFTLVIEENGADTWYIAAFLGGEMSVSDAVTFA